MWLVWMTLVLMHLSLCFELIMVCSHRDLAYICIMQSLILRCIHNMIALIIVGRRVARNLRRILHWVEGFARNCGRRRLKLGIWLKDEGIQLWILHEIVVFHLVNRYITLICHLFSILFPHLFHHQIASLSLTFILLLSFGFSKLLPHTTLSSSVGKTSFISGRRGFGWLIGSYPVLSRVSVMLRC